MRPRVILKPGQRGTKRSMEHYSAELLCVRYRYDEAQGKRFKTAELVVEKCDWQPAVAADLIVGVQVAFRAADLQQKVRQAGGKWNPAQRVWEIRYDLALAPGLKERIVSEDVSICSNKKASTGRNMRLRSSSCLIFYDLLKWQDERSLKNESDPYYFSEFVLLSNSQ